MKYTKEQLDAIEKVRAVFSDYLKNSKTLDLVWSDKLGYILITGITKNMDDFVMQPEVIYTAERLCDQLLYEIACDVLESRGHCHDIYTSTEYSCAMKSHFRKSGNQMSGKWKSSYASLLA